MAIPYLLVMEVAFRFPHTPAGWSATRAPRALCALAWGGPAIVKRSMPREPVGSPVLEKYWAAREHFAPASIDRR